MAENYHEILGVPEGAEKKDIKRAYFKQVRAYSPEKDPEKFQQIRNAYEFLMSDNLMAAEVPSDIPDVKLAKSMMQQIEKRMKTRDYDGAAETAQDAIIMFGENETFLYYQGICYRNAGRTGKSLKCFEKLVQLKPDKMLYNRELAITYWARGFGNKALAAFEHAYEMGCRDDDFIRSFSLCCNDRDKLSRGTEILLEMVRKENRNLRDSMDDMLEAFMGLLLMNCTSKETILLEIISEFRQFTDHAGAYLKAHEETVTELAAAMLMISFQCGSKCQTEAEDVVNILQSRLSGRKVKELMDSVIMTTARMKLENDDRLSELMKLGYEAFVAIPEECMGDTQMQHFLRLDVQLCIMEEWPSIRKEIDIIKQDYPEYYEGVREFVERLERGEKLEFLKERMLKDYIRLESFISGGAYFEKYPEMRSGFGEVKWDSYEAGTFIRQGKKVGRNDPCPCGSGKKFKNCCGRNA